MTTPILVPSFSSRGFTYEVDEGRALSSVALDLQVVGPMLNEAMLLSAYDLHYSFIPAWKRFVHNPEVLFIDSGGYEAATDDGPPDPDDSKPAAAVAAINARGSEPRPCPIPLPWTETDHQAVLDSLPQGLPLVLVNYDPWDGSVPLDAQIERAAAFFARQQPCLSDFLMKPHGGDACLSIGEVIARVRELRRFNVVGFAEKELGDSLLERIAAVTRLRLALDAAQVNAPIHVFGNLDPLSTSLYYAAGAEIFDGLTWLRYGYIEDAAVYADHWGLLRSLPLGIDRQELRARMLLSNLECLCGLRKRLEGFHKTRDFGVFSPHGELLKSCWDVVRVELEERRANG